MSSGLLDTSVLIDWDDPGVASSLPDEIAVSTITLAELAAGPHFAQNAAERAARQARLQEAESLFDPLPFDLPAARAYGQVIAAVAASGRSHRGRVADLLIAAVACANRLPLYTRNPDDFAGLGQLVEVMPL